MSNLNHKTYNHFRDITSIGSPIILIFILLIRFGVSAIFLRTLIFLLLIEIVCNLIKIIYFKPRPEKELYKNLIGKIDASSFPSIHSARISFVFLVLSHNTDDLLKKIFFITIIIYVSYSRIYLKKHFIIDIIFGLLIGVIFFIIHNK